MKGAYDRKRKKVPAFFLHLIHDVIELNIFFPVAMLSSFFLSFLPSSTSIVNGFELVFFFIFFSFSPLNAWVMERNGSY